MIPSRRAGARAAHALTATVLAGLLTYVMLALVSRSVSATEFDQFSVFWSLALIIGFGFFLPVEQEAARLSRSGPDDPALYRVMMRVTAALVALVVVLVGISSPLLHGVLGLPTMLIVACALVAVASGIQFAARGRLLAESRTTAFTNVLIADTVLRVALFAVVAFAAATLLGGDADVAFAFALIVAIVAAHAWAAPWTRWSPFDARLGRTFAAAVAFLVGTSLCAQILVNAGPILIKALADSPGLAGAFQASSTLARIPLAMITPIQAMLVGSLAALAVAGDHARVERMMRRVAFAALGLAAGGGLVGWLAGPWLVELIFGSGRALSGPDIALLVIGVIVHVALIILTQAVIATGRHRGALLAWAVALFSGAVVFMATLPAGPVLAVELGFGIGSLIGALVAYALVARLARVGHVPEPIEEEG